MPAPHHSIFFTGRMPFLPPNQQHQSTEGTCYCYNNYYNYIFISVCMDMDTILELCLSGGAGGKGVWGKPGSELDETGVCNDTRDPNYDSDSQVI